MRIRPTWTFAALVAALSTTWQVRAEDPAPDVAARVDAYLKGLADVGLFSGTVLVAKGGKVLVEASYGSADIALSVANTPTTQFKLMSVSKSLTAVAVMRLAQAGKLDIEDPVAKRLPSWPATWRDVTIHQLLDHTSGIANIEQEWSAVARQGKERGLAVWKQLAPQLAARPLAAPPGTRPEYSNFNFILLGLVVEATAGKPYADVVKSSVLEPAGMTKTGFDDGTRRPGLSVGYFRDKDGAPDPSVQDMSGIQAAGGIISTVGDLYRLDRALRGETLLDAATKLRMQTPTKASPNYACGWQVQPVRGHACLHHSGGANGYVADFLRFPDDDACVVVESNFAFAPIARISDDVAGLLFGSECPTAKKVARTALDACVGLYHAASRTFVIRRSGDALLLFDVFENIERFGGMLLLPLADDVFVMPYGQEKLRFAKAADGRCVSVKMESARGAFTMNRVDPPLDAWRTAVGDYRTESTMLAAPLQIGETAGRLTLRTPDGWPREMEIAPVTETLALALYSAEGGTLLHLSRDDKGRANGFRWQRNDGRSVVGVRQ